MNDTNRHYALTKRILAVNSYSDVLRSSSDYLVRTYTIKQTDSRYRHNKITIC